MTKHRIKKKILFEIERLSNIMGIKHSYSSKEFRLFRIFTKSSWSKIGGEQIRLGPLFIESNLLPFLGDRINDDKTGGVFTQYPTFPCV